MVQQQSQPMALSSLEKTGYALALVLTILLVGLHLAVVAQGYRFGKYQDDDAQTIISGLYFKEQKQETAFIIIASGLTFFISIILLFGLCSDKISPRFKHLLAAFNLILEFAIAVVIALRASNNSNLRDAYPGLEDVYSEFKYYYRLTIADTVITFVLQVVYLVVIFFGTLREVIYTQVITPVVAEVPPISNRQL